VTGHSRPIPLDATAISWHLKITFGLDVAPVTIRSWGTRGLITRRDPAAGPNGQHPAYRYDLADVLRYLTERGLIAPDTRH
jgi:hypothetical protein